MKTLREALKDYLALRRGLGAKLHAEGVRLPKFISFVEERKSPCIGEPGSDPVATSFAGFAGARRPQAPGGRTPIPSRTQIVACGLSPHPGFPLNTAQRPLQSSQGYNLLLLICTQDIAHLRRLMLRSDQRLSSVLYGRFCGGHAWPDLGVPRGSWSLTNSYEYLLPNEQLRKKSGGVRLFLNLNRWYA